MSEQRRRSDIETVPIPWRIHLLVGCVALLIAGAMGYSLHMGNRMTARYAPLVDAAMEIKLNATTAHLWFEEIISGDHREDIAAVWGYLDEAEWYARAMLEGGVNPEGTFIPLRDPLLRREIEAVLAKQKQFRAIAEERYAVQNGAEIGSDVDQRFDAVFHDFINRSDKVETHLQELMNGDLRSFRRTQAALIAVVVGLACLVGVVLHRFERRRARDLVAIQTARRETEKKEENLAITLRSIGDAVIATDAEGRITRMNPVAETLTGWSAAEADGHPLTDVFTIINAQSRETAEDPADRVLREGRVVGLANHTALIARDGTERQIADSGAPIRDAEGRTIGVVLVFRDVTEQLRMEEILVQSEKMSSLGGLAAGMAHEINNPLAGILQNVQVVSERMTGDLAANDYDPKRRQDFRQIEIVRDFDPELADVPCRKTEIQQVVLNLLINAADAMAGEMGNQAGPETEEGRGRSREEARPRLVLRTFREGDMACIEVADNGPGMAEDVRKRAFEPFFTTKEVGTGTGLGLSVSYFIVTDSHGGTTTAESAPGRGATFTVRLPLERRS